MAPRQIARKMDTQKVLDAPPYFDGDGIVDERDYLRRREIGQVNLYRINFVGILKGVKQR